MNKEQKTCQNCKGEFEITQDDEAFYRKMDVPPPTFCPECRLIRRLQWRNERALYKRACDLCAKKIVAMYPSGTPFPVYCKECWYSDNWDSMSYGREYDFSKDFFSQFKELSRVVPRIALQIDNSVNCDYANQIGNCKNCYLISSGSGNEDCMFDFRIVDSRNVVDSFVVLKLENCYEVLESRESSLLKFSSQCSGSFDLLFCNEVNGSQHCFMSMNVRNGSYWFRNERLTKEAYEEEMKKIDTGSYRNICLYQKEMEEMLKKGIRRHAGTKNVVNCTGNILSYSNNTKDAFHGAYLDNCRYVLFLNNTKDSYDINNGCCMLERSCEVCTSGLNTSGIKFSVDAWPEIRDSEYIDCCRSGSSDLFGCISLRGKQYCILNKQYSKEEYMRLKEKIIQHMKEKNYIDQKGRIYAYGEFFPPEMSPFSYNESTAFVLFPKKKDEVKELGLRWREGDEKDYKVSLRSEDIPDHIKDIDDSILGEIIECKHKERCEHTCTSAFRIIPEELSFYRKHNLPIPRLCPNCRHGVRVEKTNPLKLWHRTCACGGRKSQSSNDKSQYENTATHEHGDKPCQNEFETSFAPEREEVVYCESCYQKEVI